MSIRNPIFAILAVSALSAMTQIAFADDDRHECTPKITSSTIVPSGASGAWIISGHCLEEATNVSLAKDDGMGYENIPFSTTINTSLKTSLIVPFVPRAGFADAGIPIAHYLLQVKRCKNVATGDKCTTFDEKFVFVLDRLTP